MTNFRLVANNSRSILAGNYTAGSNTLSVTAGEGAKFPSPNTTTPIRIALITAATYRSTAEVLTIFECTSRSIDTFTGLTAIEGTIDRNYSTADVVELRWTAAGVTDLHGAVNSLETSYAIDTQVVHLAGAETITGAKTYTANVAIGDGSNLVLGTTTGSKIGTSTSQKIGFFNRAPVAQPSGNLVVGINSLGLVNSPTIAESDVTNLVADLASKATDSGLVHLAGTETITGAKTFNANIGLLDGINITTGIGTGTKIGANTSQRLGFYGATPVGQPTGNLITGIVNLGLMSSPSISATDIPNLDASKITSGQLSVAQGGTGLETLTAKAVLLGNGTSALGTATIGTVGRVLTDQGGGANPAFIAPVTATVITGTLPSLYTTTTSFANSGLSLTLPTAGTYILMGFARAVVAIKSTILNDQAWITSRFFDSTNSVVVSNSEVLIMLACTEQTTSFVTYQGTSAVGPCVYTVTGPATIQFQAQHTPGSGTITMGLSQIDSNSGGRTSITAVRIY